jgi:hypothetical protein
MDAKRFVELVKLFGSSSSNDAALDDLSALCSEYQQLGVVLDDVVPGALMEVCMARLANAIQSNQLNVGAWKCLCFLSSGERYSGAEEMLTVFARRECCRSVIVICGTLISESSDGKLLMYCFMFLFRFTIHSGDRRGMVYDSADLRQALFGFLAEGRFAQASCSTQTDALEAADSVARLFFERPVDAFLRDGGLHAVKCATLHVLTLGAPEDHAELARLDRAASCLFIALRATAALPSELRANLSADAYKLSSNDMFRMNVAIYRLLPTDQETVQSLLSTLVIAYGDYLLKICGPEALQRFLMYKPPRDAIAKPAALFMAEWAIKSGGASQENYIMGPLLRFSQAVPEVAELLTCLPLRREWITKGRRCGKPSCNMDGEQLYNKMKKCGRCKAVYYCCDHHQQQHWPEHRLTCVKIAAPVAEEQDIEVKG